MSRRLPGASPVVDQVTVDPNRYELVTNGESPAAAAALDTLAVPEFAFVLVAVGLLCIVVRMSTPALGWSGLGCGVILLVLGVAGLTALPVHAAGVLMLGFAAGSLCMEVLSLPGMGLHAVGGGFSLILAGIYLTADKPGAHPAVVIPLSVAVAILTYVAGRRSWRYVRDRPLDPSSTLVGRGIVVLAAAGPIGQGVVAGQVWDLRADDSDLEPGQTVRVTETAAGWLVVKPVRRLDSW